MPWTYKETFVLWFYDEKNMIGKQFCDTAESSWDWSKILNQTLVAAAYAAAVAFYAGEW